MESLVVSPASQQKFEKYIFNFFFYFFTKKIKYYYKRRLAIQKKMQHLKKILNFNNLPEKKLFLNSLLRRQRIKELVELDEFLQGNALGFILRMLSNMS